MRMDKLAFTREFRILSLQILNLLGRKKLNSKWRSPPPHPAHCHPQELRRYFKLMDSVN